MTNNLFLLGDEYYDEGASSLLLPLEGRGERRTEKIGKIQKARPDPIKRRDRDK